MPDTPAGRCADAYYKAFNSGENSQMQDFFEHYYSELDLEERSIESRLNRYNQLRDIFKTLTPAHIGLSLDLQISLLCIASGTEDGIIFRFQLQDPQSNKIDFITISGISYEGVDFSSTNLTKELREGITYTANRSQPIDDVKRKDTVEKVVHALKNEYLYPEIGQKMAEKLMQNLSSQQYDELTRAGQLADRLTEEMVAISKDRHFGLKQAIQCRTNRSMLKTAM